MWDIIVFVIAFCYLVISYYKSYTAQRNILMGDDPLICEELVLWERTGAAKNEKETPGDGTESRAGDERASGDRAAEKETEPPRKPIVRLEFPKGNRRFANPFHCEEYAGLPPLDDDYFGRPYYTFNHPVLNYPVEFYTDGALDEIFNETEVPATLVEVPSTQAPVNQVPTTQAAVEEVPATPAPARRRRRFKNIKKFFKSLSCFKSSDDE